MSKLLRGASASAIQKHYDLGNDFYGLWLDPEMVYSSALWDEGDDLATAQVRKLDYHLKQARARDAGRLLDVGCGWGGLLKRAVGQHDVRNAVGLTLSRAQLEHARAKLPSNCEIRLESWSDHVSAERYDSIISVGALEHFARTEYSDAEKVDCYRRFFEKCQTLLKARGWMSLQTFAYGTRRSRDETLGSGGTRFLASEIFEETDPPRLIDLLQAAQGIFEVVSLRNDRLHYARTCRVWLKNLKAKREEATAMLGEERYAQYVHYLNLSYLAFQVGYLDLYRITLRPFTNLGVPHAGNHNAV